MQPRDGQVPYSAEKTENTSTARVWIGSADVTNAEETERERFREMDLWIGWARIAITVAVVVFSAVAWREWRDGRGPYWLFAAVATLAYSPVWLWGLRLPHRLRLVVGWISLAVDTCFLVLAAVVTPLPYSAWMVLWCPQVFIYVGRHGPSMAYVLNVFVAVSALLYNLVLSSGRLGFDEWAKEGIIYICVLALSWLVSMGYERDRDIRHRLSVLATRDGLTGLYNHRFFNEMIDRELSRADREGREVSVLMVDIDHFKRLNDTWGHLAGDEVLRVAAGLLADSVRNHDCVFRYGGEEFAIILSDAGTDAAARVGERTCERIRTHTFPHGPVTISIGRSTYPALAGDRSELVRQADAALYLAKARGRDRTEGFDAVVGTDDQIDRSEKPKIEG